MNFSCTDQSTIANPALYELENGAFVRFVQSPPATASDPQGISYSGEIYDPKGNVASYTVALKATIGG
ncbi:hypothetical protein [Seonamhaeicola aphaedonensis]|nr:hypothetical protein [Seonamhaeicola aphaedonensis]